MNAHVSASVRPLAVLPLVGLPLVEPGDDLARLLITAIDAMGLRLERRDVVVVTSKIVSKAEGPLRPSRPMFDRVLEALRYASVSGKDPRLVQLVLGESEEVAALPAGRDDRRPPPRPCAWPTPGSTSRTSPTGTRAVLLLPVDPDRTAAELQVTPRRALTGRHVAVVIADSSRPRLAEGDGRRGDRRRRPARR